MKVFYVDTSSSCLYAGITEDNNLIAEVKEELGHDMSKFAMPRIADLFNKSDISPKSIDKIIVVNGPGSFTGIRIGLTIAKVYAWALNIPITTISSLEAMAYSYCRKSVRIPIIDARRNYSYAAIYDGDKTILKPSYIENQKLLTYIEKLDGCVLITNDDIKIELEKVKYDPNILDIVEKFSSRDNINPHLVNPEYLKLTEAEESKI